MSAEQTLKQLDDIAFIALRSGDKLALLSLFSDSRSQAAGIDGTEAGCWRAVREMLDEIAAGIETIQTNVERLDRTLKTYDGRGRSDNGGVQ